ncbi:MAG: winged helix-turn-helix domain-containing protein [Pirellulales bacterium]
MQPHLHPQDVVVALKLTLHPGLTIQKLADSLGLSLSAVHRSVGRAKAAGLLRADRRPVRHAIREFVLHGLRYAFPAVRGGMTPGMPTAYATLPLSEQIHAGVDPIPVWPDSSGEARGESLEPLYPSVPAAARADAELYQLLALIDVVRSGRARERKLAEEHLTRLLDG